MKTVNSDVSTYGEAYDSARLIARDARNWKSYQQRVQKAAPSTSNHRLGAVSSFYKWAVGAEVFDGDPTAGASTIRLPARQPQSLTQLELRRLPRAVHRNREKREIAGRLFAVG